MAHIPYGYRIERGKAVVVPGEAERIRTFLQAYLDGLSIRKAGEKAAIPLCVSALRGILDNEVYLGTDYYPPIVDRDTFDAVRHDCLARTHAGPSRPSPIEPVRSRFEMALPDHLDAGWLCAVDLAAYLYSLVKPSDRGHAEMTAEEKQAMASWREQAQVGM